MFASVYLFICSWQKLSDASLLPIPFLDPRPGKRAWLPSQEVSTVAGLELGWDPVQQRQRVDRY